MNSNRFGSFGHPPVGALLAAIARSPSPESRAVTRAGKSPRRFGGYSTIAYAFPTPVLGGEAILSMSSVLAKQQRVGFRNLDGDRAD